MPYCRTILLNLDGLEKWVELAVHDEIRVMELT